MKKLLLTLALLAAAFPAAPQILNGTSPARHNEVIVGGGVDDTVFGDVGGLEINDGGDIYTDGYITAEGTLTLPGTGTGSVVNATIGTDDVNYGRIYLQGDNGNSGGEIVIRHGASNDSTAEGFEIVADETFESGLRMGPVGVNPDLAVLLSDGTTIQVDGTVESETATPKYVWDETDGATDNKHWDMVVASERWRMRVRNDALDTSTDVMSVDRTGTTVDSIDFDSTIITATGSLSIGGAPTGYNANADNFIVYEAGNSGMTIATNSTNLGTFYFADSTSGSDRTVGGFVYDHSDNSLVFRTSAVDQIELDSDGDMHVGADDSDDGAIYVYGDGTTGPGEIFIYPGAGADTTADYFKVAANTNGEFLIRSEGGTLGNANYIIIDPAATDRVEFPINDAVVLFRQTDTTATANTEVIAIHQEDADDPFIDFRGTSGSGSTNSISTTTSGNASAGHIMIEINGTEYWLRYFTAP